MLDTFDSEGIDQVYPFFGAKVDVLCGKGNKAPITKMLTVYSGSENYFERKLAQPWWRDEKRLSLAKTIRQIRAAGTRFLKITKPLVWKHKKWHMVGHTVSELRYV